MSITTINTDLFIRISNENMGRFNHSTFIRDYPRLFRAIQKSMSAARLEELRRTIHYIEAGLDKNVIKLKIEDVIKTIEKEMNRL